MAKISLEEREEQGRKIIDFMMKRFEGRELVWNAYNNAIDDVLDAIDVYAKENPQHRLAFVSLKEEIKSWMPLPSIMPKEIGK